MEDRIRICEMIEEINCLLSERDGERERERERERESVCG